MLNTENVRVHIIRIVYNKRWAYKWVENATYDILYALHCNIAFRSVGLYANNKLTTKGLVVSL